MHCDLALSENQPQTLLREHGRARTGPRPCVSASHWATGPPRPLPHKARDTPLPQAQKARVSGDRRETELSFITLHCFSLMFLNFFFPNLAKEHLC